MQLISEVRNRNSSVMVLNSRSGVPNAKFVDHLLIGKLSYRFARDNPVPECLAIQNYPEKLLNSECSGKRVFTYAVYLT